MECTGNTLTCHVAGRALQGCQVIDLGNPSDGPNCPPAILPLAPE